MWPKYKPTKIKIMEQNSMVADTLSAEQIAAAELAAKTLVEKANETSIVTVVVIGDQYGQNAALTIEYNGVQLTTPEQVKEALQKHYQINVCRKYGITLRDDNNEPLKNQLVINGSYVSPKIPALKFDENGAATENMPEYYERTKKKAAGAYATVIKGLERIDFMPQLV